MKKLSDDLECDTTILAGQFVQKLIDHATNVTVTIESVDKRDELASVPTRRAIEMLILWLDELEEAQVVVEGGGQ